MFFILPQANTAGLGHITKPIWKTSRNNTILFFFDITKNEYEIIIISEIYIYINTLIVHYLS